MSLRFVLYLLSIWFLVRFLAVYLAPLFRSGIRMQGDVNRSRQTREGDGRATVSKPSGKSGAAGDGGDYIDFEEVR